VRLLVVVLLLLDLAEGVVIYVLWQGRNELVRLLHAAQDALDLDKASAKKGRKK